MPTSGEAKPVPVIQTPVGDAEPELSPDGRWLAASTETGGYDVFVQPFPATGARWQISSGGGRQPKWRRRPRVVFVTNDRKFYAVAVRASDGVEFSSPHYLFEMPSYTIGVRNSYVPSRDGQRFLINKLLDTTVSPIYVDLDWAATVSGEGQLISTRSHLTNNRASDSTPRDGIWIGQHYSGGIAPPGTR